MQEDITFKQCYLYKQIIEGGYNPEQFQEFITAENPAKGMNLELWTMNELKGITSKFKYQVDNHEEQKTLSPQPRVEPAQQIESPRKNPSLENKQEDYYRVVQCKRPMMLKPMKRESVITIDAYEKREGGIFEKSYFVFQVKVDTLKSCVMRRYSDFEGLREGLEFLYPGLPIPPLAKKGKIKRKEQKHLHKRMYILQKFLNVMMMIAQIRSCELFEQFLLAKDLKEFYSDVSRIKKSKMIPLEKLETIDGQIEMKIDPNINKFIKRSQKYFSATQPEVKRYISILNRIYKDFKGAATMLEGCAQFMASISTNCRNLNKNWTQYEKEMDLPPKKNNVYSILSEMASRYAQVMLEQAKVFRKQMYSVMKYESFMMMNYCESLEKLSKLEETFNDHKMALLKKKQKLYEEGNISKWGSTEKISVKPSKEDAYELMLPKETKELLKERDNYALFNYQIYKELQRYTKENDLALTKYLEEIISKESGISSKGLMIWADLMIMNGDLATVSSSITDPKPQQN